MKNSGRSIRQPDGREVSRNKGVIAAYKQRKRDEAEARSEEKRKADAKRDAEFKAASATPPEAT